MSEYFDSLTLRRLRRLFGLVCHKEPNISMCAIEYDESWHNIDGDVFQTFLQNKIHSSEPFLLTRFGCGVIGSAIDAHNRYNLKNVCRYLLHQTDALDLQLGTISNISIGDGFYPTTHNAVMDYGSMILNILPDIDVLATIIVQERLFADILEDKVRCTFPDLEPYRFDNPWTAALRGKKVLVIHPFVNSIRYQYENNRMKLFANPECLPEFDLKLIRAVQDKKISSDPYDQYENWFDALDFLKGEIDKVDFDVAILGCGAFGMPLAHYIKMKGKQAIHLGGATQYLFGIRSSRGESMPDLAKFFNEYWIRPLTEDKPSGYKTIENGCYW